MLDGRDTPCWMVESKHARWYFLNMLDGICTTCQMVFSKHAGWYFRNVPDGRVETCWMVFIQHAGCEHRAYLVDKGLTAPYLETDQSEVSASISLKKKRRVVWELYNIALS
jgi:hypothetical protein